ncbi:MAG TPA: hypothetical protein VIL33_04340 [Rhodothermia bacterium]
MTVHPPVEQPPVLHPPVEQPPDPHPPEQADPEELLQAMPFVLSAM